MGQSILTDANEPTKSIHISTHDTGTVFVYMFSDERTCELVRLTNGQRVELIAALTAPEANAIRSRLVCGYDAADAHEPECYADRAGPISPDEGPDPADGPVIEDGTLDDVPSVIDPNYERGFEDGRIDAHVSADAAQAAGDTLGYERGYVAGFEDGCRYAYDGGDGETDTMPYEYGDACRAEERLIDAGVILDRVL